jgi:hypothetical protein
MTRTSGNDDDPETLREIHREVLDEYRRDDPSLTDVEIRAETLWIVDNETLQSVASDLNLYPEARPTVEQLRRALARAGVFESGVGDNRLLQVTEDTADVIRERGEL